MSDSETPWTAAHWASLSFTNSQSLLKLMSVESVTPSNHPIFCHPLLLLPSIFPSIRVSSSHQVAQVLELQRSVLPKNIHGGFLLGLMALNSLLSKGLQRVFPSITLWHITSLALGLLYGPTPSSIQDYRKKTIALTIGTFLKKVMSLLFNMLSRLVIAFLPRRKLLLISWLLSPPAVILEPKKRKSVTVSTFPHLVAMK